MVEWQFAFVDLAIFPQGVMALLGVTAVLELFGFIEAAESPVKRFLSRGKWYLNVVIYFGAYVLYIRILHEALSAPKAWMHGPRPI